MWGMQAMLFLSVIQKLALRLSDNNHSDLGLQVI